VQNMQQYMCTNKDVLHLCPIYLSKVFSIIIKTKGLELEKIKKKTICFGILKVAFISLSDVLSTPKKEPSS